MRAWFFALVAVVGVAVYVNTVTTRTFLGTEQLLADASANTIGKGYLTRQQVWTPVVGAIAEHPLTGLGLGWQESDLSGIALSTHSQYLQVALQTGLPGMGALLLLLYVIGRVLILRPPNDAYGRIGLALLSGLVVQQGFEVSLTENTMAFGGVAWVLLGVCMRAQLPPPRQCHAPTRTWPGRGPGSVGPAAGAP